MFLQSRFGQDGRQVGMKHSKAPKISMSEQAALRPLARQDIEQERIEDELFLYDPAQDGAVHRLNSGAAIIWMLCDGTRSVTEIAEDIALSFDLAETVVRPQVDEAIQQFYDLGLLVDEDA
jgi:hypothetical protein